MAKPLLSDDLWSHISPLLPPARPRPKGGRPPIPDRAALTGILFVLKTGLPWEYLPAEMGCGSGMSCWRRLHEWQQAGIWSALHRALLEHMERAGQLDWSRASLDSISIAAKKGGLRRGRTPRTVASRVRSATSSWTDVERRSAP